MKKQKYHRREIIAGLATAPLLGAASISTGCAHNTASDSTNSAPDPKDVTAAATTLARIIGPWPAGDTGGDGYLERFGPVWTQRNPPADHVTLLGLHKKLRELPPAAAELSFRGLAADEQNLLRKLVEEIYNYSDVRYALLGMPPSGQCMPEFPGNNGV